MVRAFGRIDILVNNAGVALGGPVEELSEEAWDLNHDINLKGTFLMCRAVIPFMKRQRWGRILNAASFAAIVPIVGSAAYAASKAGVHFFTRALAGELGPWNVTVNCYAPGMIPTEMNRFAEAPPERQQTAPRHLDHPPLGRAARRGQPGRLPRLRSGRLHHRDHGRGERRQAGHPDPAPGLGSGGGDGGGRPRLIDGTITHFELITVRLGTRDGTEGLRLHLHRGDGRIRGSRPHRARSEPLVLGAEVDRVEALWTRLWWHVHYGGQPSQLRVAPWAST